MMTVSGSEFSFFLGVVGIVLEIALFCVIFSLPSRFREQREYIEAQHKELEKKLDNILELQKK